MRYLFRNKEKETLDPTFSSFNEKNSNGSDSLSMSTADTTVKHVSCSASKEPAEAKRLRSNLSLFLRPLSIIDPELAKKILEDVGGDDERQETEVVLGMSSSKVIKVNDEDGDSLPFVEKAAVDEEREPSTFVRSVLSHIGALGQFLAHLPTDVAFERIQSRLDRVPSQSLETYSSHPEAIKPVQVLDKVGSIANVASEASRGSVTLSGGHMKSRDIRQQVATEKITVEKKRKKKAARKNADLQQPVAEKNADLETAFPENVVTYMKPPAEKIGVAKEAAPESKLHLENAATEKIVALKKHSAENTPAHKKALDQPEKETARELAIGEKVMPARRQRQKIPTERSYNEEKVATNICLVEKSGTKTAKPTFLSGESENVKESLDPTSESESMVSKEESPRDGSAVQNDKGRLVVAAPKSALEIKRRLSDWLVSGLPAWLEHTPPVQKKRSIAKLPTIDACTMTTKVEDPEPALELHTAAADLIKPIPSTSTRSATEKSEASSKVSSGSIKIDKFEDQPPRITSEVSATTKPSMISAHNATTSVQAKPTETQPKTDDVEMEVTCHDEEVSKSGRRLPWENGMHLESEKGEVAQLAIVDVVPDEAGIKATSPCDKDDINLSTIGRQKVEDEPQVPVQEIEEAWTHIRFVAATEAIGELVQIVNLSLIQEDSKTRRDSSAEPTPRGADYRCPDVEKIVIQQFKDDLNALVRPDDDSTGGTEYDTFGNTLYTEYDNLGNTIYEEDASISTLEFLWNAIMDGIHGAGERKTIASSLVHS